jgi:hypothetical protein
MSLMSWGLYDIFLWTTKTVAMSEVRFADRGDGPTEDPRPGAWLHIEPHDHECLVKSPFKLTSLDPFNPVLWY